MSSHDFRIPDLITKKKNGGSLTPKEIRFFITGVVNGEVKECKHCCRKANDEQEAETPASKKKRGTNAKAAEPTEAIKSNKRKDRKRKKNSAPETVISKRKKADTEPKEPQEPNKPGGSKEERGGQLCDGMHVEDCQLGAMLMAICWKDLTDEETVCLTKYMRDSGDLLGPWPAEWKGKVVGKHSTGGVGDKVSLILAPALAACGMKVPMISGRGLAHTGGTLDKLEAIPGLSVYASKKDITSWLEEVGCCIVGQTASLVPADKRMYAVRDVTGTIDNFGLIAGSIISKKAAEKLDALVLDVKFGVGAFMKERSEAIALAEKMVKIGNQLKIETSALITDMNNPLGKMIGNALEVAESIQCLHGNGPSDLEDLVLKLGARLLYKSGNAESTEKGEADIKKTLKNGEAVKKFQEMIINQGVDRNKAKALCAKGADMWSILPKSMFTTTIKSPMSGIVHGINALTCAKFSLALGAGRYTINDKINHAVGLELCVSIGDTVSEGKPLMIVHHDSEEMPPGMNEQLIDAFDICLSDRVASIVE
uniref:Thymidine phosphorylase n=1 Tax=Crassostrea virginica TaxID=6565 RepID=A0A8B8AQR1_CRAVI|nr:thymidine phosphorylase-like isoform X2 [Crassostrea virginica]